MKNYEENFIYISLTDQFKRPGCPICRRLRRIEENEIFTILYENVNNPYLRKELMNSLGFCSYHSWMMIRVAEENPILGGLGPAIIYGDILAKYLESIEKNIVIGNGICIICENIRGFDESYVEYFAEKLDSTDILERYENSPSILCKRHYEKMFGNIEKKIQENFKKIHTRKIQKLITDLEKYIEKHSYDSREEFTESEYSSWKIAVEILKGYDISISMMSDMVNSRILERDYSIKRMKKKLKKIMWRLQNFF